MASTHEQPKNSRYETCASEIPIRRHVDLLPSPNNSPEQIAGLKSRKPKQPLDYLIWSSMLVISGILICGFVAVILLLAAYKAYEVKE